MPAEQLHEPVDRIVIRDVRPERRPDEDVGAQVRDDPGPDGRAQRDEPVAEVLEAARRCPELDVHVTGDPGKCPAKLREAAPPNVCFTGFLTGEDYERAVLDADVVLARHTLEQVGEALAAEAGGVGFDDHAQRSASTPRAAGRRMVGGNLEGARREGNEGGRRSLSSGPCSSSSGAAPSSSRATACTSPSWTPVPPSDTAVCPPGDAPIVSDVVCAPTATGTNRTPSAHVPPARVRCSR